MMNQAIHSVERSIISFRWASKRSFSFYIPASASASGPSKLLCEHNNISHVFKSNRPTSFVSSWRVESNNYRGRDFSIDSSPIITDSILSSNRKFSSLSAATVVDASTTNANATIMMSPQEPRQLSALQQANIEQLTPGKAIYILQRSAAKGTGNLIRQSDFVELCNSARPGKLRDALVIATALKEFKRNNRFVLQLSGSKAAVEGMLRSRTSTWKVQDGKPRVKAALFVAEQILNEDTGLYFAIETVTVDQVLEELYKGLIEMQANGFNVSIDSAAKDEKGAAVDEGGEALPPSPDVTLINDALRVTHSLIQLLIKRKSRPEWEMKRRAARRYLKLLQIGGGPYRSTLQLATKISLLIGGSAVAQQHVIEPFERAWWTKFVDEESLKLIQEARELEERVAFTSATDEEVDRDYESEADEEDASSTDDEEEELTIEEESSADDEAENDKRD